MKFVIALTLMTVLSAMPLTAQAKVEVFACSPEWAALSKEVGGDLVEVYSATNAHDDVHHMRAKPSLLEAMGRANIVFCSGASLESEWLPKLIRKSGGPDVQENTVGWFMASDYVEKLEVMEEVDHSVAGHIHPEGNPHVHLNPHNLLLLAEMFADRLYQIDSQNAQEYDANLSAFTEKWNTLIEGWEAQAEGLKNASFVVYHNNWSYLTDWLGINVAVSLETHHGHPPTTSHLEAVLQNVKQKDVKAILVAPFESEDAANWLSERTNIPVLHLPYTVGGSENVDTLEALFTETIAILNGENE
ncbi:MAG: zinc ABC transporter substrate-binding protein [Alphaproteobacteria bacterium]|nr:zinc ABC transporter substrate-binding protein [Alphaproteobacteria bacterium]